MKVHFSQDKTTGREQVVLERESGDTEATLEEFAASIRGSACKVHNTAPGGQVTLDEIVVTLD